MIISEALADVQLLYIDAASFIYYAELRPIYADKMIAVFSLAIANQIGLVTSTVTLTECFTKPLKDRNYEIVDTYERMFSETRDISLVPVNKAISRRAADFRAAYNLRTPDSLHIATATMADCDAFLTNDFGLRRVTEFRVLTLDTLEIPE